MMAGLKDYFNRRKQSKLYKQWVQQSQLPAEEIPPEMQNNEVEPPSRSLNIEASDRDTHYLQKRGMINIPIKYLLLIILIMAVLLVALSVVTTLLLASS